MLSSFTRGLTFLKCIFDGLCIKISEIECFHSSHSLSGTSVMVVRNIAVFTGGAVIGAVAMGTYFKSKQDAVKAVAVPGAVTPAPTPASVPVPVPTPQQPQVPARPSPPPVVSQPPGTAVGNPRKIMPHGFPGTYNCSHLSCNDAWHGDLH